jgi:hypothetical protein
MSLHSPFTRPAFAGFILALVMVAACADRPAPLPEGFAVLATLSADLDGAGDVVRVSLVGRGAPDSPLRENLALQVDGGGIWPLPAAASVGYAPRLDLGDVSGDGRADLLVTADTGGSGGIVAACVVEIGPRGPKGRTLRGVWDSETGPRPRFGGALRDGPRAVLVMDLPGAAPREVELDLADRLPRYLETGVCDSTGALLRAVDVWGDAVMQVDVAAPADGGPGLHLIQQPRGVANADRLAVVSSLLVLDGGWRTLSVTVEPLP